MCEYSNMQLLMENQIKNAINKRLTELGYYFGSNNERELFYILRLRRVSLPGDEVAIILNFACEGQETIARWQEPFNLNV